MATSTAALMFSRRKDFTGVTDKYSPASGGVELSSRLTEARRVLTPLDVSNVTFGNEYHIPASRRLALYRKYWMYYEGRNFGSEFSETGKRRLPANYSRRIVDKRVSWAVGRRISLLPRAGNELVAEAFLGIWKYNNYRLLWRKAMSIAMTAGDAFLYFSILSKDRKGNTLPKDQWRVKISVINPAYVHPVWSENNPSEMDAVMLQFPVVVRPSTGDSQTILFSQIITADKVDTYQDLNLVSSVPNALGLIPLVHIAYAPVSDGLFGSSILTDVIPYVDEYAAVLYSLGRIVQYHGEPTTIITGATMNNIERSANKVWSGFPADAKVTNLEMKGDLAAMFSYGKGLQEQIYEAGRTPRVAFNSEGIAMSGSTGAALSLLFQPLIEATDEAHDFMAPAFDRSHLIMAAMHKLYLKEDLLSLADDEKQAFSIDVDYESFLPRDETAEMDRALKMIEAGIWSRAEAARRIGRVHDTALNALEIAADRSALLVDAYEKAVALGGSVPDLSGAFVGSQFLHEDLLDVAAGLGSLPSSSEKGTLEGSSNP